MNEADYESKEINTRLLSAVSHELRGPLTAIKGYSSMLLEYFTGLTAEEAKEYIRSIDNATDSMTRLVDKLLDVTRLEEGRLNLEKTPINIINLIKIAVKEAEIRNGQYEILTSLEDDLPKVLIDPTRIRQVVDDLIDNAARRSPKGTEILISAKVNDREIEVNVTGRDPGIPGCKLCNIPELLYKMEQLKDSGANTSRLDLYMCQRIIEAHGGKVWAESIIGKGTTIKFTLPLSS